MSKLICYTNTRPCACLLTLLLSLLLLLSLMPLYPSPKLLYIPNQYPYIPHSCCIALLLFLFVCLGSPIHSFTRSSHSATVLLFYHDKGGTNHTNMHVLPNVYGDLGSKLPDSPGKQSWRDQRISQSTG